MKFIRKLWLKMDTNNKEIEKYPDWLVNLALDIKKEMKKQVEENRL